jgi:YVTN family beta-propeller protein
LPGAGACDINGGMKHFTRWALAGTPGLLFFLFFSLVPVDSQPLPPSLYEVWVTNQKTDTVRIYNGANLALIRKIPVDDDGLPATSKPHTISFTPDGRYAYVANVGDRTKKNNVVVIDAAEKKIVARIPAGPGAHMVVSSPDGSRAFVANAGGDSVLELLTDLKNATFKRGRSFTITGPGGAKSHPVCLAFSADGTKLYVSNAGNPKGDPAKAGFLAVLEASSGRELSRIENLSNETCGLELTRDGGKLYFSMGGSDDEFGLLDTATGKIVRRASTGGKDPHGLGINPGGFLVWITNRLSDSVTVLSATTGKHFKSYFNIGDKPDLLAFSPDGSRVFITLRGEPVTPITGGKGGTLPGIVAIKVDTGEIVMKVPIEGDPHGIAVRSH